MPKNINVLLVSPYFFPTNTYQQELCQKIADLYPNIEITILCYQTTKTQVNKFGSMKVYYVPCFSIIKDQFVLPNYFELFKIIKKLKKENNFNLVFCETRFFDSAWWLPILARFWKVPSIIIDHCASSIKHEYSFINFFGKIFDWFIIKFILSQFNMVLGSSRAVVQYLKSFNLKNVNFLGIGVDTVFFNPNKRVKKSEKEITITFASRLLYTKGVDLFYQSVKPLLSKYPDILVKIGGNGPQFNVIKDQIAKEKFENRILLMGALSREKISRLLANLDIFVYPSFHHDGIPNIILEAAASGCAIVTSPVGGVVEVMKNNQTGIVVDELNESSLTQSIEELINNVEKRLNLGKSARLLVIDRYDWEKVAELMSGFMFKAIDQP